MRHGKRELNPEFRIQNPEQEKMDSIKQRKLEGSGAGPEAGVPGAAPSGRRRLWGSDTRAFSPGFNMAGLRPCWTGVNVAAGEVDRAGKKRAGMRLNPGAHRKRRPGRRIQLGKGGKMVGERTGFAHLFPDDSMQVVDFPHLAMVRHFSVGHKNGFGHEWNTYKTLMGIDLEQEMTEPSGDRNQYRPTENEPSGRKNRLFRFGRVLGLVGAHYE